jgi:hypothetical protein
MRRTVALYVIAWVAIPVAFAGYVSLAYSWGLARGTLPFLGTREVRWWVGFVVALLLGSTCVAMARRRSGVKRLLWPAIYIVGMAAVLIGTHLAVACAHGDCF